MSFDSAFMTNKAIADIINILQAHILLSIWAGKWLVNVMYYWNAR